MNQEDKQRELVLKKRRAKRAKRKKADKIKKDKIWKEFFNSSPSELKKLKKDLISGKTFFCIDTEEHEFSRQLLEIGISIYSGDEIKTYHFIVKENYNSRNKKFVPDNKDNFNFGESDILSLHDIKKEVKKLALSSDFLAGHSVQNDRALLKTINANNFDEVFDTQIFQKHLNQTKEEISLINLCNYFDIETECLHNAGNDAHYTFMCLLKIGGQ